MAEIEMVQVAERNTVRGAGRTADATGLRTLLKFYVRRERAALVAWIGGTAALVGFQAVASQNLYDTPAKLAALRETIGGSPAVIALGGPEQLLATIGGEVVFEIFGYAAIVLGLMSMFLVGRHTRTDEENGRAELLRSTRVGRDAPVATALTLAAVANLAAGVAVVITAVATGLPLGGSVLFGAALAGVGLTFATLTALAAQIFENPRSVYGSITAMLGLAYVLRAIGDVGNGAMSWLSPIGWGQRTYPYVDDRWWPILLPLVAGTLTIAAAVAVSEHRDFGAGIFGNRAGRAEASWLLHTTTGLAWRLHRGSIAAWATGVFVLSAAYGSFGDAITDFMENNPQIAEFLPGGAEDAVDAYLALTLTIAALMSAGYGVNSALRARREETADRAESLVAANTNRLYWFGGHITMALVGSAAVLAAGAVGEGLAYGLTIGDPGQIPRLLAAAAVYVPAVWLILAVAVAGIGFVPRAAEILAWTYFAYCLVAEILAESFNLPEWTRAASPFQHLPQAPLDSVGAGGILGVTALALFAVILGVVGFGRRDLG
ncbi:ABC transporter permease [Gordonia alkanivorans]|uniref:ABC transporter permease n=1 Tax=Gordonia alkanivorans TaxID=84096 RepID=UPI00244889C4|nr:ABC transporter permease [Gordonia alkanivorans]MDH3006511.1 ABC transporter permease [Gordonia alkanivorans]MDH3048423.1 ABC transporter permease [Gordonia alkanivorans]